MVQPSASAQPPSAPDPSAIGLETFGFDLNNREIASLIYIGFRLKEKLSEKNRSQPSCIMVDAPLSGRFARATPTLSSMRACVTA